MINVTIDSSIRLDPNQLPDSVLKEILSKLTIPNPAKKRAVKEMLYGAKNMPDTLKLYRYNGHNELVLPRGIAMDLMNIINNIKWDDKRSYDRNFNGEYPKVDIRDYQENAAAELMVCTEGIYKAPTGSGKTRVMLHIAYILNQKTLIICEKKDIAYQWLEITQKMGFESSMIGDDSWGDDGDLVISLRQSIHANKPGQHWFDKWGLVILDECFPKGSLIDTPLGQVPVENLSIGDKIYGCDSNNNIVVTEVKRTFEKSYEGILAEVGEVKMTPEHPVWTADGYKAAQKVTRCDMMGLHGDLDGTHYLQVVPAAVRKGSQGTAEILQRFVQRRSVRGEKDYSYMRAMWKRISLQRSKSKILFSKVLCTISGASRAFEPEYAFAEFSPRGSEKASKISSFRPKPFYWREVEGDKRKSFKESKREWIRSFKWWQWKRFNRTSENVDGRVSRFCARGCAENWFCKPSLLVRNRFGSLGFYVGNRDRWPYTSREKNNRKGSEEGSAFKRSRMGGFAFYKQRSFKRIRENKKSYYSGDVFNIETDTSNYFAEGLLVHNCHHASAETVFELMQKFPARYRYGCSATPDSDEDLFPIAQAVLGPVVAESTTEEIGEYLVIPSVKVVKTKFEFPYRPTERVGKKIIRNNYNGMMVALENDKDRNLQIMSYVHTAAQARKSCLVISKRKNHLYKMYEVWCKIMKDTLYNYDIFMITGDNSDEYSRIKHEIGISAGCIIFSTLADEGTDIPKLDRLFLTYPGRKLRGFEQAIGRIMRPHPGKIDAKVYDFRDFYVPLLNSQYRERAQMIYAKKGYDVEQL